MDNIWRLTLICAAVGGFLLTFYISQKKRAREKLICPLGSDCDKVIYSEYSRFFGIPVEILGLIYYGLVAASYALFLAFPTLAEPFSVFTLLTLTFTAFIFSLYLTLIQTFALKQWCVWCLASAIFCAVIFTASLSVSEFGFIPLLARYHSLFSIGHVLGFTLGLGAATITDIFFIKFLKDFRISKWEAAVMNTLSQIIWFALALVVLTGIALYLPQTVELNRSSKFLLKMLAVFVIIINGAFLNLLVAPKLIKISSPEKDRREGGESHYIRRITFALGTISIVSWYSAFFLGILPKIPLDFSSLLLIYLFILGIAIVGGQLLMKRFFGKRTNFTP